MKGFVIGVVVMGLSSFAAYEYEVSNATAEVNKVFGLTVFTDSSPVMEYEVLGTIKSGKGGGFLSDDYSSSRDRICKKAKKEYPTAEGVILFLNRNGKDGADVIKFK